ncbi:MAG: helix-turn-helix transcriptional regulator [Staphylococcus equorum]|nr:helix-turn-helix transcriptional regulator [Staphylococcus equorum]
MKSLLWLKDIRHKKNLTQQEVADLFGGTREQYNAYENGRVEPQEYTKFKIARALEFDVELWLEGDTKVG